MSLATSSATLEAALILASPDRADDVAPHGRTIVTGSGEWRKLAEGDGIDVVPRRRDDLAWLFYTSGTTGPPKARCSPMAT